MVLQSKFLSEPYEVEARNDIKYEKVLPDNILAPVSIEENTPSVPGNILHQIEMYNVLKLLLLCRHRCLS